MAELDKLEPNSTTLLFKWKRDISKIRAVDIIEMAIKENNIRVINIVIAILDNKGFNNHVSWMLTQYPNKDFLHYIKETGNYDFTTYSKKKSYSKDITTDELDKNWIAWTAATYNYTDIIDLMLKNGVTSYDMIAVSAAEHGYKEIVDDMIRRGADNYDEIAYFAALNGYIDIVNSMLSIDPDYDEWIQWVTKGAIEANHSDIVEAMVKVGGMIKKITMDNEEKAYYAAKDGNLAVIKEMIALGVTDYFFIAQYAAEEGYKEIVREMVKIDPSIIDIDLPHSYHTDYTLYFI